MSKGRLKADVVLDAANLSCPIPLMKTVKQVKTMEVGEILEVQSTDPGSKVDITRWSNKIGHSILAVEEDGRLIRIFLRKEEI